MQRSRQEEKAAYRLVLGTDTQVKKQAASNSVLGHKDDPCSHQILVTTGNAVIGMNFLQKEVIQQLGISPCHYPIPNYGQNHSIYLKTNTTTKGEPKHNLLCFLGVSCYELP